MTLTYRGVSYEYNPPVVETAAEESVGKYRGLDWRFRNLKKAPVQQATLDLKYRGVAYQTQPIAEPIAEPTLEPAVAVASLPNIQDLARSRMLKQNQVIKNRQQVLLSRSAAEVGLTADISQYWNHIQGQIHPTFRRNYERSRVALS